MKAHIIQIILSLTGIVFSAAHRPVEAGVFIVGAFVIWALKGSAA